MVTAGIISVVGIILVVIGGHFGGGDHFDGGDHFGGGTSPSPAWDPNKDIFIVVTFSELMQSLMNLSAFYELCCLN